MENNLTTQPTGNPTLPTLINLPRAYTPERAMADPEALRLKIVDYFSLLTSQVPLPDGTFPPRQHPTPPGLAMAMGLRGFDALMQIIQRAEVDPDAYPEESLNVLHVARSLIEEHYLINGIREVIPQQFCKFMLSAYFNRSEKTIQENLNARDNNLNINILGLGAPLTSVEQHKNPTIEMALERGIENTVGEETFTITYNTPAETQCVELEDL